MWYTCQFFKHCWWKNSQKGGLPFYCINWLWSPTNIWIRHILCLRRISDQQALCPDCSPLYWNWKWASSVSKSLNFLFSELFHVLVKDLRLASIFESPVFTCKLHWEICRSDIRELTQSYNNYIIERVDPKDDAVS